MVMNQPSDMRAIPLSAMVDIQTSDPRRDVLSDSDRALTMQLVKQLKSSGIIRDVESIHGISSEEELLEVLRSAEERSLSEKELNPDYYDPDIDEILNGLDGVSNPLMEKFDNYEGLDYNPKFRGRSLDPTGDDENQENGRRKQPSR